MGTTQRRRTRSGGRITELDRETLAMLAKHRVVVTPQVASLLRVSDRAARARLGRLRKFGLVAYERIFVGLPATAWVTSSGLRAIGSKLPPAGVNLDDYRHDIGVGWLWLAARRGELGPVSAMATERELRTHDMRADRADQPLGVGVGGFDWRGRPSRHYPDLLLTTAAGQRLAVELELTRKSSRRLATVMRAYAGDGRIDRVLYVVPGASLASVIRAAATHAGIADLVRVHLLTPEGIQGAPALGERGGGRRAGAIARGGRTAGRGVSDGGRGTGDRDAGRPRREGREL